MSSYAAGPGGLNATASKDDMLQRLDRIRLMKRDGGHLDSTVNPSSFTTTNTSFNYQSHHLSVDGKASMIKRV